MAIVVESISETSGQGVDNITISAPSGIQSNDLLYIIAMRDNTFSNIDEYKFDIPTGWTDHIFEFSSSEFVQIQGMYKVSDGTETDITLSSLFSRDTVAWYVRISGVDTTSPIDVTGSFVDGSSPLTIPAVTTSSSNCMAFVLFAYDGGDGDPFTLGGTGWPSTIPSDQYEEASFNSGATAAGGWATKTMTGAGSSVDAVLSDNGEGDGASGLQFALSPDTSLPTGYPNLVNGVSVGSFSGVDGSSIAFISGV